MVAKQKLNPAKERREKEQRLLQLYRNDGERHAASCLRITVKDPVTGEDTAATRPFIFNSMQRKLEEVAERQLRDRGFVRMVIPKARQMGVSTWVEGRFYRLTSLLRGRRALILTHLAEATGNLFAMVKRFWEHDPGQPKLNASNTTQLLFRNTESGYRVATAESDNIGHSFTLHLFHGSEVAYWPRARAIVKGVLPSIPTNGPGTEIILESTGVGPGDYFHQTCMQALPAPDSQSPYGPNGYELVFLPWHEHQEYQLEVPAGWACPDDETSEDEQRWPIYQEAYGLSDRQLFWAFTMNAQMAAADGLPVDVVSDIFRQQFPAILDECFLVPGAFSLIHPRHVKRAMEAELPDQEEMPLVLGLDTSGGGGDQTRLVSRRGRVYGREVDMKLEGSSIEVAMTVQQVMLYWKADHCFIDLTGGYGTGTYDWLKEVGGMGRRITGIHFGAKATDPKAYANKRVEMWARLRDHLKAGADVPNSPYVEQNLLAPRRKKLTSAAQRLQLESKDEMKERVGFSPDWGDAAALTHAGMVSVEVETEEDRVKRMLRRAAVVSGTDWTTGGSLR